MGCMTKFFAGLINTRLQPGGSWHQGAMSGFNRFSSHRGNRSSGSDPLCRPNTRLQPGTCLAERGSVSRSSSGCSKHLETGTTVGRAKFCCGSQSRAPGWRRCRSTLNTDPAENFLPLNFPLNTSPLHENPAGRLPVPTWQTGRIQRAGRARSLLQI